MVSSSDLWFKESGNDKGREKLVYQYMPLFLPCFFLSYVFTPFYHLVFLFSFVRFLFFSTLCVFPPLLVYASLSFFLFMATCLPFILLEFMGYLPFDPKAIPTIFSFLLGISPGSPTNLLVFWPPHMLRVCLPHHSPFLDKIHCFISLPPHLCFASPQTDKG